MWPQAPDALAAAEILFLKNPDTDARATFFLKKVRNSSKRSTQKVLYTNLSKSLTNESQDY